MNKFNVGDLVLPKCGPWRETPHKILYVHQEAEDNRVYYVYAYKGDIPFVSDANGITLHTAAKGPVEEGIPRDLNNKYGDWKLGQPSRDLPWENLQVSRGPDGEIVAYRVKVEPKVKPHTLYGEKHVWNPVRYPGDTHKITFTTIDGEPDCSSVKMEKL